MNSKQKLSQIESFSKGKIKEFLGCLEGYTASLIDWDTLTLHLQNYSYDNNGMDLMSVEYRGYLIENIENLAEQLKEVSITNRLGIYVMLDNEEGKLYFFNKALNNHIKTLHLMVSDENKKIRDMIKKFKEKDEPMKLVDSMQLLGDLMKMSENIYVEMTYDYVTDEGEHVDSVIVDGIVKKVLKDKIVMEDNLYTDLERIIKVGDKWELFDIQHWERDYKDIKLKLSPKE